MVPMGHRSLRLKLVWNCGAHGNFQWVNRPGFPGDFDLRWVLLPPYLLNLGLSERLNSCQRPIPRSSVDEPSRS